MVQELVMLSLFPLRLAGMECGVLCSISRRGHVRPRLSMLLLVVLLLTCLLLGPLAMPTVSLPIPRRGLVRLSLLMGFLPLACLLCAARIILRLVREMLVEGN